MIKTRIRDFGGKGLTILLPLKADIDWKQVAPKANFNTAKQARDKWAAVRSKITAGVNGGGENGPSTPVTSTKKKSTPASKKRKNSDDDGGSTKKSKKAASLVDEEDDEEAKGFVKPEDSDGELV